LDLCMGACAQAARTTHGRMHVTAPTGWCHVKQHPPLPSVALPLTTMWWYPMWSQGDWYGKSVRKVVSCLADRPAVLSPWNATTVSVVVRKCSTKQ
jgi:hypothetical protein